MNEIELIHFLDEQAIPYQRYDHLAVFTVEAAEQALPGIPGASTKNLFLCDAAEQRFFLLMTMGHKRVNLKRLGAAIGVQKGLRFASEVYLEELLNVGRGAVTALAVINDTGGRVELFVDRELWQYPRVHCHPLTNTATLVIATPDLERFFSLAAHPPHLVEVEALPPPS
jgi:Ala-tRNA(Pro) deacylase